MPYVSTLYKHSQKIYLRFLGKLRVIVFIISTANTSVSIRQVVVVYEAEVATELIDGVADVSWGEAKISIMVQAENGRKEFYIINVTVGNPLSIDNQSSDLFIYPNPILNELNIRTTCKIGTVEIYSLTDQKVYANNTGIKQIDLNQLSKGVYIALITIDGKLIQKKITKN